MTTRSIQMRHPVPYRVRIARSWTKFHLLCCSLPYALYHLILRPERPNIPEIGYSFLKNPSFKERVVFAYYDVMHNLLFDSYTEITGLKVLPATGPMFNLLLDLTKCLDGYLDKSQKSVTTSSLDMVLEAPPLRERIEVFRHYLQLFGREKPIMAYLRKMFTTYYEQYTQHLMTAGSTLQFEDILATAQVDSGMWRRCGIEIVAIFNSHEPPSEALQDFYLFGMVVKFADDMFDLRQDLRNGNPNLLYALICQDQVELTALQLALRKPTRLNAAWWQTHCPNTYSRFFDHIEHYYHQITSKKLRFVTDLLVAPALLGIDLELLPS
jgi:hypothetical protein